MESNHISINKLESSRQMHKYKRIQQKETTNETGTQLLRIWETELSIETDMPML